MRLRGAAGILAIVFFLGAGSAAQAQSDGEPAACGNGFTWSWVHHGGYNIYVREYSGAEPAIVLMHGFPDNLRLYDRVVPYLCGRHLVLFDFLGWGNSDKPERANKPEDQNYYTFNDQLSQLNDVITQRGLVKPVLVGNDMSGPAAIDWALGHPQEIGGLVLLPTFYNVTPYSSMPELIGIFGDLLEVRWAAVTFPTPLVPEQPWTFRRLTQAIAADPQLFRGVIRWQMGTFFRDDQVRQIFVPKLLEQFEANPSTIPALMAVCSDLSNVVGANTANAMSGKLTALDHVRIIWGDNDPYLNAAMAQMLQLFIPKSELILVKNAYHYVQMDEPETVAGLILTAPHSGVSIPPKRMFVRR